MRTIQVRIRKLEELLARQVDAQGRRPADVLRERRRRWFAKEGRSEEHRESLIDPQDPPRSIAEALRRFRGKHVTS